MLSSHYVGLVLIVVGLLLFFAEIVATSYGLSLLFGLVCFILGILSVTGTVSIALPWDILAVLVVVVLLLVFFLTRLVLHLRRRPKTNGLNVLIGQVGEVLCKDKRAWLQVNGELWRIKNDWGLKTHDQAQVVHADGLTVKVKKIIGEKK